MNIVLINVNYNSYLHSLLIINQYIRYEYDNSASCILKILQCINLAGNIEWHILH